MSNYYDIRTLSDAIQLRLIKKISSKNAFKYRDLGNKYQLVQLENAAQSFIDKNGIIEDEKESCFPKKCSII